jgi:hypothetical protein
LQFLGAAGGVPPSGLPAISPTGGEITVGHARSSRVIVGGGGEVLWEARRRLPAILPTCGGDARQGRGGLAAGTRGVCEARADTAVDPRVKPEDDIIKERIYKSQKVPTPPQHIR